MPLSEYKLNWQRKAREARRLAKLCVVCGEQPAKGKKWCQVCLEKESKYRKQSQWWLTDAGRKRNSKSVSTYRKRLREKVIKAYGGKCACCGESEFLFLELDHVNNDGAEDRKKYNNTANFWLMVIREGFPDRYQVLCSNCNLGKVMNGGICPHEMKLLEQSEVN